MHYRKFFFVVTFMLLYLGCSTKPFQTLTNSSGKYSYEYVNSDPTRTRIYTLDNGLKVYLSKFENAPRIHVFTAVKAGGKDDPENNTGLAHYLEHIMFKGNKFFGTKDYEKEKPLLDSIENLFNKYAEISNNEERKRFYKKIDAISNKAASYAIPNEYDKMISLIGGKSLNAYTTEDRTVYTVDIPSNELGRFLTIEGLRFKQIVNRLFHTELEAVYEEKNRALDNDLRKQYRALFESLFPSHPYGKQSVLGTVDHLKNPSITEIRKYFNKYYKPNNVAICMSGELDFDKTISLIDKHFGDWKPNLELKKIKYDPLKEIESPIRREVTGPEKESVLLGFRFNGEDKEGLMHVELIDMLLSNSAAGLIDLNLVQKQKVLGAFATIEEMNDYSIHILSGTPKEGQSLKEVENLLLAEIDNIKKGLFDDELLIAVLNDLKKTVMQKDDSDAANYYRADAMVQAFTRGEHWSEKVSYFERLSEINKKDIVEFTNKYYKSNYAVVYKNTGKDNSVKKIEKPSITKVPLNREVRSKTHEALANTAIKKLNPKFLDFKTDLDFYNIGPIEVIAKENKENDLFKLTYQFDFGKNLNPKIGLATGLMNYIGVDSLSPENLKKAFYNLGAEYSFQTSSDGEETSVTLSGLSENMEASIKLFENLLINPISTQEVVDKLVGRLIKSRLDAKKDKNIIHRRQLLSYSIYGEKNPASDILTPSELKKIKQEELIELIKSLSSYSHRIIYYGDKDRNSLTSLLKKYHKIPTKFLEVKNKIKKYQEKDYKKNYVFWTNFDMVQTEIILLSRLEPLDNDKTAAINLFNQYFGGGMNSIVFQEIREAQGLAYAVFSNYSQASKTDRSDYLLSYVGVQNDKQSEALSSMFGLINELPKSEQAFEIAKKAILNKIESERITKSSVLSYYLSAEKKGIDYDIREKIYDEVKTMTLEKLKRFHEKYIKEKRHNILLIGNRDNINFKNLKKYGTIREISLETLFGF